MPAKAILTSLGFLISWLIVLPLLIIGGGLVLLIGATLAEIATLATGSARRGLSAARAREIARGMCSRYSAGAASQR